MPFGMTTGKYVRIVSSYIIATFAGAELVHRYYSPDLSIPRIPPKKGELKTKLFVNKSEDAEEIKSDNLTN